MYRLFTFMLLSSLSLGSLLAAPLKIMTVEYPPYSYLHEGKLTGINFDLVKEAFVRAKIPVEIQMYTWVRGLKEVEQGEIDGLFNAYKTKERELYADYSDSLMIETVSLFVKKSSTITFNGDLAQMNKYSFGGVKGYSYGSIFDAAVTNEILTNVSRTREGPYTMRKLLKDRYQVLVSDSYYALDIFNKMESSALVKELTPPVQENISYVIFSKKRKLHSTIKKFNEALQSMRKDGTYQRIINQYIAPQ